MKMRVVLEVDVDEEAYAAEYGLHPDEVEVDARGHVTTLLGGAVDAKAAQMGTFSVRHMSTQVFPAGVSW
jgi:hypothetical protein